MDAKKIQNFTAHVTLITPISVFVIRNNWNEKRVIFTSLFFHKRISSFGLQQAFALRQSGRFSAGIHSQLGEDIANMGLNRI